MTERNCTSCGKAITEFYKSVPWACKQCHRKRASTSRKTEIGRQHSRNYSKQRYLKFRDKCLARAKVGAAIKAGVIKRPDTCEACSIIEPVEGHHSDYSQPLQVTWLCQLCHKSIHNRGATV